MRFESVGFCGPFVKRKRGTCTLPSGNSCRLSNANHIMNQATVPYMRKGTCRLSLHASLTSQTLKPYTNRYHEPYLYTNIVHGVPHPVPVNLDSHHTPETHIYIAIWSWKNQYDGGVFLLIVAGILFMPLGMGAVHPPSFAVLICIPVFLVVLLIILHQASKWSKSISCTSMICSVMVVYVDGCMSLM